MSAIILYIFFGGVFIINVYKRLNIFICFLLIFTMSFSFYNERKASANPLLGVAVVAPEVAVALGALTLTGYGAWQLIPEKEKVQISQNFKDLSNDVSNFNLTQNQIGEVSVGWSLKGLQALKDITSAFLGDNYFIYLGGGDYAVSATYTESGDYVYSSVLSSSVPTTVNVTFTDNLTNRTVGQDVDFGSALGDLVIGTSGGPNGKTAWVTAGSTINGGYLGVVAFTCYESLDISGTVHVGSCKIKGSDAIDEQIGSINPSDSASIGYNYGIPVSNTGSIDAPDYSPVGSVDDLYPDVLPDSGKISDVPQDKYKVQDVSVPVPTTGGTTIPTTGDTTGDTTVDTPTTGDNTGELTQEGSKPWILNIPILGDILAILKKILDFLLSMIGTLIGALTTALTKLFVPDATYFPSKFDGYKTILIDKLGNNNLDFLKDASGSQLQDIYIDIFGQHVCIVKITMYEKFRSFAYMVIRAFFYFLLVLFNYNQIIKFLRGSIFSDYDSRSTVAHIQQMENSKSVDKHGL